MRFSLRRLVLAAVIGLSCAGCKDETRGKIRGWPPPAPISFGDPDDDSDVVSVAGLDVVAVDTRPVALDTTPPPPKPRSSCERMVDMACDFFGKHSDGCAVARTKELRQEGPEADRRCEELIADFTGENIRWKGSPCSRFASELCRSRGHESTECRHARTNSIKHQLEYLKRACLGDMMMLRAEGLFK